MNMKGLLPRRVVARNLNVSVDSLVYQERMGRFKPIRSKAPKKGIHVLYPATEIAKAIEFYRVKDFTYVTDALHLKRG